MTLIEQLGNSPLMFWRRSVMVASFLSYVVVGSFLITTYSYAQVRPEEMRRDDEKFHPHMLLREEQQPTKSREEQEIERRLGCAFGIESGVEGISDRCKKPPQVHFDFYRQPGTPGQIQLKPPLTPGNSGARALRQPPGRSPASPQE
jgi:hypothetical protein